MFRGGNNNISAATVDWQQQHINDISRRYMVMTVRVRKFMDDVEAQVVMEERSHDT